MSVRNSVRPAVRAIAVVVLASLAACGGGGGGGSAAGGSEADVTTPTTSTTTEPTAQPSQPLTAYLANGEGGIGTPTINVGANGVFEVDTTTYTLENTGASGCTLTSRPTEAETVVCNQLADGKAYLFCSDTTTSSFEVALFRQADFQTASLSELAGTTMTRLACGVTGVRTSTETMAFNADASIAVETWSNSTWTYGTGIPALKVQPSGSASTGGYQQRWAIYKVAAGGGTQYLLLDLWQAGDESSPDHAVSMYFLQK